MTTSTKVIEFKFERTILAPPEGVYDAWLSPKTPGTPWNMAEKLILGRFSAPLSALCVSAVSRLGRSRAVPLCLRVYAANWTHRPRVSMTGIVP